VEISAKEPWDSSTERAKTLIMGDFGTPKETAERAKPARNASTRREAVEILKDLVKNSPLVSRSGLPARLSTKGIGKIVSNQAVNTSFSPEAHYLAAVNIDRLYANAIEPWQFELNPAKNNDGLKNRRYLYGQRLRIHYSGKAKPGDGRGAGRRKQSGIPRWNIPNRNRGP
jgi:hypothetical protein